VYLRHCLGVNAGAGETDALHLRQTGQLGMRLTAVALHLDALVLQHLMAGTPDPVPAYQALLERALAPEAGAALHAAALAGLTELVGALPAALGPQYAARLPWLRPLLRASAEPVRDGAGRLVGLVAGQLDPAEFTALVHELLATRLPAAGGPVDELHGAVLALGRVAAAAASSSGHGGGSFAHPETVGACLAYAAALLGPETDPVVGAAACRVRFALSGGGRRVLFVVGMPEYAGG
jgi:hypothetical protein